MAFTITIKGISGDVLKMDAAARQTAEDVLERGIYRMQGDLQAYPAAPPHSTYRRTGTLGRRWLVQPDRPHLRFWLGNNTQYAPYVQDQERQAKVHRRTGWPTAQGVAEKREGEIAQDMATSLSKTLGGT